LTSLVLLHVVYSPETAGSELLPGSYGERVCNGAGVVPFSPVCSRYRLTYNQGICRRISILAFTVS
jgi:hypothetical protein